MKKISGIVLMLAVLMVGNVFADGGVIINFDGGVIINFDGGVIINLISALTGGVIIN